MLQKRELAQAEDILLKRLDSRLELGDFQTADFKTLGKIKT